MLKLLLPAASGFPLLLPANLLPPVPGLLPSKEDVFSIESFPELRATRCVDVLWQCCTYRCLKLLLFAALVLPLQSPLKHQGEEEAEEDAEVLVAPPRAHLPLHLCPCDPSTLSCATFLILRNKITRTQDQSTSTDRLAFSLLRRRSRDNYTPTTHTNQERNRGMEDGNNPNWCETSCFSSLQRLVLAIPKEGGLSESQGN